ncbi:unnamed protein product [Amoebophrya sp. A25]|nr:unnamed protein product [Amoebophrya sp. A25]|eukprot:GSA25T00008085001.1
MTSGATSFCVHLPEGDLFFLRRCSAGGCDAPYSSDPPRVFFGAKYRRPFRAPLTGPLVVSIFRFPPSLFWMFYTRGHAIELSTADDGKHGGRFDKLCAGKR